MLKFIIGFGAGFALGMVLAPRSGANVRGIIGKTVNDAATSVEDRLGEMANKARSVGHQVGSESAPDLGEGDFRDELGLPITIKAVRL